MQKKFLKILIGFNVFITTFKVKCIYKRANYVLTLLYDVN